MESGIVFAGGSKSQLKDVLTWHDGQGRRVWLHSRQTLESGRVYISLSVQTFSSKLPKVSEEEKRLRMKLAAMHEYQLGAEISATSMREIATGEIIQTHSRLVMSEMINQRMDRKIQLVSEIQSRTTSAHRLFLLDTAEERALALQLFRFEEALTLALVDYKPSLITSYLWDVAKAYSGFFQNCPVLKAPNEGIRQSRLLLCDLTARVLKQGLELLGISVLEKM